MKALGKLHKKPGLWLYDAPIPEVGPDDLLIKICKTSLCGTDLHIYEWDEWAQKTIPVPITVGHEFFGIVEKMGSNVKNYKKGDRVAGEGHIICGTCRNCRAGRFHLCPNTLGVGVNRTGCFAEYVPIPAFNAFKLPKEIPDDIASILDPLGNAVHTTLSFDLVGEDVLITGAGPIGLMAVAIARKVGARHIVITDLNDYRLKIARKMGATRAINIKTDSIRQVMKELEMAEGFTVGLEMSGSPNGLKEMFDVMSSGGKIALLGILPPQTVIDGTKLIFKSLLLKGIYGREMFETWYKVVCLLQEGLDISPVITHSFPPEEFEKGFEMMHHATCGK
ncbi:MAG: L-threonine 3-dehydrogenase, partial [Rhabdochlamydiaceae bacterium]